jgi:hypothetical protein
MQHSHDLVDDDRDEHPVESKARSPRFHIDRWLGRDPVAFLRHRREELRDRPAVVLARGTNLDAIACHRVIVANGGRSI